MPIRFLFALTAAIVLSCCTGTESDELAKPPAEPLETTAPATTESILDILENDGRLSTFVTISQRVGLDSTLTSEGPFTVFAPTNAAFSELEGSINTLNDRELRTLLEYHLLHTRLRSPDLPGEMQISTVAGPDVFLLPVGDGLAITDAAGNRANVVTADIDAPNGVIHAIDRVLASGQ